MKDSEEEWREAVRRKKVDSLGKCRRIGGERGISSEEEGETDSPTRETHLATVHENREEATAGEPSSLPSLSPGAWLGMSQGLQPHSQTSFHVPTYTLWPNCISSRAVQRSNYGIHLDHSVALFSQASPLVLSG